MSFNEIDQIIRSRRSIRAFTSQAVDNELLKNILETASYAPSGTNTQPWKVYVVTGETKDKICNAVIEVVENTRQNPELAEQYQETFRYYPTEWVSPFIDRRRQNGWALYGLLGIQKGDKDKMHAQHLRNYRFFDAPVGLFFTLNKVLGDGAKLDTAMFMQNIMLSAKSHGLDTCAQAAWNKYHRIVLPLLGAEDEILISAMALGYADKDNVVNTLTPPRAGIDEFTVWKN
ncbi:MAG: nitroreductase [Neisseriaceae bacterium]|nr:nitroreductase [Neisseriaceae bacterium]MBQ9182196.1 nitroreductase [Neisseriaceae bacterium]MBR1818607.1 nitroreductase [Neisseriaceae bacterium]